MKKRYKYLLISLSLLGLIFLGFTALLFSKTYQASSQAESLVKTAISKDNYLLFEAENPKASVIFYQGALVEEAAYAPMVEQLSQSGINVYLITSPANLPLLQSKSAQKLIEKEKLSTVFLAGHSLGGVVASWQVEDSSQIKGLILLASYPDQKTDLSKLDLPVLSITASQDKVLNWKNFEAAKSRINSNLSTYVTIQGGNHSGFGTYGQQDGDGKATISQSEQEEQIVAAIISFITNNTEKDS
ncbi:alpha/beta hydrolase [Streptococcus loxodontisalivarius]|uniref:Alpha-beta hydrolase superfamily lysophospholipase n=1 Tax=Streptococcus loxodontisalivarius TaxID=1349415 RepID=A0ABS2PR97_9STRE|nr:alpha/beta hydrolase [Streptococcus loxodontisalivarius]MBM7642571.1 alpha-beta hydrolase superfamily lysophospholipase [Streptococcus loxodontisalivarius]